MGATEVIGWGGAGQLDAMLADLERRPQSRRG
jgi:hypothetical protein